VGLACDAILSAVEIVPIHTSPKRKRGNDLAISLALRVSVSLNREQYKSFFVIVEHSDSVRCGTYEGGANRRDSEVLKLTAFPHCFINHS